MVTALVTSRPTSGVTGAVTSLRGSNIETFPFNRMEGLPSQYTFTRGSVATYTDSASALQTAGINVERFNYANGQNLGLLIEDTRTNFFLNSGAPVTQTSGTLATGTYTLWMVGAGSVAVAGNSATITGAGTSIDGTPVVFVVTVTGTVNFTITGSPTRVQCELGPFASSYIATAGTTVVRSADNATRSVNFLPGTFLIKGKSSGVGETQILFSYSDGSSNNTLRLQRNASGDASITIRSGGGSSALLNIGNLAAYANIAVAVRTEADNFAAIMTGNSLQTDTSGASPTGVTTLKLGRRSDDVLYWGGTISSLMEWDANTFLSNAALTSLVA